MVNGYYVVIDKLRWTTTMARPRAFDEDEVLDRATEVFWQRGYDGASMAELVKAMGLNSPSLYAAFGSKRGLFEAVLDRYDSRRAANLAWILAGATAREVAERSLYGIARGMTAPDKPLGCLLLQGGVSAGTGGPEVPEALSRRRLAVEAGLLERFERAKREGDLPATADPATLARFIGVMWNGLGVHAAAGATHEELRAVAEQALAGWPG